METSSQDSCSGLHVCMGEPNSAPQTHSVDPDRLAHGTYCNKTGRTVGEGDICASYSADRIGMGQPVRKPFRFEGALWVCVCTGRKEAECYRLIHPAAFVDQSFTYAERCSNGVTGRADPNGFYHGMQVCQGGQPYILCGPKTKFIKGEKTQLSLF